MAVAALLATMPHGARADCYPKYTCQKTFDVLGFTYQFDLSQTCNEHEDYSYTDSANRTYNINICGTAVQNCLPSTYATLYEYGAVVQTWGERPDCPPSNCTDPFTGEQTCCTADCEVLGVGAPYIELLDPDNPVTGGLVMTHHAVRAADQDPYWCPPNPITKEPYERRIKYEIKCQPSALIDIHDVGEWRACVRVVAQGYAKSSLREARPTNHGLTPHLLRCAADACSRMPTVSNVTNDCSYTVHMGSSLACACETDCDGRQCGSDGCGGSCGTCPPGNTCNADDGSCCAPQCVDKNCGFDGCGGQCGPDCPTGYTCSAAQICEKNGHTPTPQPPTGGNGGAWVGGMLIGAILTVGGYFGFLFARKRG